MKLLIRWMRDYYTLLCIHAGNTKISMSLYLADIPQMAFVSEPILGNPDHRWKEFRSAVIRGPDSMI